MPIRRLAIAAFLGLIVMATEIVQPAAMEDRDLRAARQVRLLADQAAAVLQRPGRAPIALRAALGDVLRRHIDIPLIARAALGPAWRGASPAERARFRTAFDGYLVSTIARRLQGTADMRLTVIGVTGAGTKDSLVKTRVHRTAGVPVEAVWRVRTDPAGPKVIDIAIAGVSLVLTSRGEFASVVRRAGIDGLIQRLRAKAELTAPAAVMAARVAASLRSPSAFPGGVD